MMKVLLRNLLCVMGKSVAKNVLCCNFCEHWYCLTCSKLKKVVDQALKESPESLMWFCISCLTTFPSVKKMMIKGTNLEEKYDKLDERVNKIEKHPNNVENIARSEQSSHTPGGSHQRF